MRTVLFAVLLGLPLAADAQNPQSHRYGPSLPLGPSAYSGSLRPVVPGSPVFELPRALEDLSLLPSLPAVASLVPASSFAAPVGVAYRPLSPRGIAYRPSALASLGLAPDDGEDPDREPGRNLEPFGDLPNLRQVDGGLWRSAQPTAEGFRQTKEMGVKTVLLLRFGVHDDEKKVVERLGMRFVHVPMHGMNIPTPAEVDRALAVMEDEGSRPVLVHCRHGRDRTGTVVAAYRVVVQGWTIDAAYKEAMSFGYVYKGLREFLVEYKRRRERRP